MAVVPEAEIGLTFVKLDSTAAKHMVKDIYKSINRDDVQYNCNMNEENHWVTLFNLQKMRRLRGNARFGFSILTDGIAACVQFKVLKPTSERPVKKSVLATTRANTPARDITSPGLYSEKDHLTGNHTHLVAIDPGIKSILTGRVPPRDEVIRVAQEIRSQFPEDRWAMFRHIPGPWEDAWVDLEIHGVIYQSVQGYAPKTA